MIDVGHFDIKMNWDEKRQLFLMAAFSEKGYPLDPNKWRHHLFTWHKQSFYGSLLDVFEKDTFCLKLSSFDVFTFFANMHHSSFIDITWFDDAKWFHEMAPIIAKKVDRHEFGPDFHAWKQGHMRWKLQEMNSDMLLEHPYAKQWVSEMIQRVIENDEELLLKWEDIQASSLMHTDNREIELEESAWLEKIGWLDDTTPFYTGLRLTEPEQDGDSWKLETVLIEKENENKVLVFADNELLPEGWKDKQYIDKIREEQQIWIQLVPWLADKSNSVFPVKKVLSEDEAWLFLTQASTELAEIGIDVLLPEWWEEIRNSRPALRMKVDSSFGTGPSYVGMDSIVSFNWKLATRDMELEEEEFLQLVEEKRKLIQVRGKWIKLDPAFIKYMKSVMKKVKNDGLHLRDVLQQHMGLPTDGSGDDEISEHMLKSMKIELNGHLLKMIKSLQDVKSLPAITITEKLNAELRPYQKQGVEWLLFLRRFGFGACLADDMGLGKTIQIITYLLHVKEQMEEQKPALIICPTSVLGNWQKELERFAPSLNVHLHYGANREKAERFAENVKEKDVVLTTYTLAAMDEEELHSVYWNIVGIDEAQNIKNAQTKQSKAIRKLKGDHKIALTGTPIENRLSELWSIFDFMNPGYLGGLQSFRKQFVQPIEAEKDTEKLLQLQRLVRPFLLRRTKKDKEVSLNLPEKQEQKEYCPLTVEQASLYEQVVQDTFSELAQLTGMKRRGLILSMLTRLKQICNHPYLYLREETNPKNLVERSHKSEKLIDLVEHIIDQNESCLIFTQYIEMGRMIQQMLKETTGEDSLFLQGSLSKTQRDEMVEHFQNQEKRILILSLRAGGTGLNLTTANHVIHYDRWWNPAVENQATDRAYRIGQSRFVHVHKLITTGTLEEKIDEMIDRKQALSDEIITGENWITELSTDELHKLFALNQI